MTDTSTVGKEVKTTPAAKEGVVDGKKVPIEAVSEARAKTRAANERAEAAEKELESQKSATISNDDLKSFVAAATEEARRQVEAELAPIKAEAAKAKMALRMGLSEEQADKVIGVKTKNPNLTDDQALLIAKSESSDLFQPQRTGFNPAIHGALPIGGTSPTRTQTNTIDYVAKIAEAKARKDMASVSELAKQMVHETFKAQYERFRPQ